MNAGWILDVDPDTRPDIWTVTARVAELRGIANPFPDRTNAAALAQASNPVSQEKAIS